MEIDRKELIDVLKLLKPCLSTTDYVPILTYYCFYENRILACNGDHAMVLYINTGLECAVPGDVFLKLVLSFTDDVVKLNKSKNGTELLIICGKSKVKLSVLSKDDFFFKEEMPTSKQNFKVDSAFGIGLVKSLWTVHVPKSSGVNVVPRAAEGITLSFTKGLGSKSKELILYSTSGKALGRIILNTKTSDVSIDTVVLPRLFCQQVVKLIAKFGEGTLFVEKDSVQVIWGEGAFLFTRIETDIEHIKYEAMVLSCFNVVDTHFVDVPKVLVSCLERSSVFMGGELDKVINISLGKSKCLLKTKSKYGEIEDTFSFKNKGKKSEFIIEIDPLKVAVKNVTRIAFSNANNAGKVKFIGTDNNYLTLVDSCTYK